MERGAGYKYLYRISKQGLQYYGYLVNPEQVLLKNESDRTARLIGIPRRRMRADIIFGSPIPEDIQDILLDFEYGRGGLAKRFPLRYRPSLAQRYAVARKMLRNCGVTDLEFARELEKTSAMADMKFPHLDLYHKIAEKKERKKTLLGHGGDNTLTVSLYI